MATAKVDTRQFKAMCEQLAAITAKNHTDVLESEVGKVLEGAIRYTKSAKVSRLKNRHDTATFSTQPATLYAPKHGRKGVNISGRGDVKYYLLNRYPNLLWSAITTRRRARLLAQLRARGLSKKSWLTIAQRLGIKLDDVPGYVPRAIATTGREYPDNIIARKGATKKRAAIAFTNAQPTVNAIGGERALKGAIAGRVKFFNKNAEKSVFADVKRIAKAYPGMKIQTNG